MQLIGLERVDQRSNNTRNKRINLIDDHLGDIVHSWEIANCSCLVMHIKVDEEVEELSFFTCSYKCLTW